METFDSPFGKVVLTAERWNHIVMFHPEILSYRKTLQNVLAHPDITRRSKLDPTVKICYSLIPKRNKYIAIVVKTNTRNFVLTAYLTSKIKHLSL